MSRDHRSRDHRSVVRRGLRPESASRPVVSPISPSVVYASPDADTLDAQYEGRVAGWTYAREGHPNWAILADKLDWMERAEGGDRHRLGHGRGRGGGEGGS